MLGMTRRDLIIFGLSATLTLSPSAGHAGRDSDHERARLAVERGEALPLADILERVRPVLRGEVVGVSFERKRDRWVYEFKVIRKGGGLVECSVDAATAEILDKEEAP